MMYTISKQTTNFATSKWKKGLAQPLERLEKRNNEGQRESTCQMNMMSSPTAVFNGKNKNSYATTNNGRLTAESSQHEENVFFIAEAWNKVQNELEMSRKHNREGPTYYQDKRAPSQAHRDIEPFDLEKWRETRLLDRNVRPS